jgi:hypothetical protein
MCFQIEVVVTISGVTSAGTEQFEMFERKSCETKEERNTSVTSLALFVRETSRRFPGYSNRNRWAPSYTPRCRQGNWSITGKAISLALCLSPYRKTDRQNKI